MLLQKVPKRHVGRVFKDKIWSMDRRYTIKHRSCSWKGKGSRRKGHMLLQIEKVAETSDGDLTCHVFILEDEVAHVATSDPSGILTIEK